MRLWLPVLSAILLVWSLQARADADDVPDDLMDIDVPAGLCPFDGVIDGVEVDPALRELVLGNQTVLAAFEPCGDSAWPMGSAISVGLLAENGEIRQLGVTRAQYLARLARRHGPADLENLLGALDDPQNGVTQGMVPAGIVHQDDMSVHFGFILTAGSRDEADWRALLLGNSLVDGYPLLVTSVGPYGSAEDFRASVARQVAFTETVIAANASSRDMGGFDYMTWIKYGVVALVILGGAYVTWDWCRRRRKVSDLDAETDFDADDDLDASGRDEKV